MNPDTVPVVREVSWPYLGPGICVADTQPSLGATSFILEACVANLASIKYLEIVSSDNKKSFQR